MTDTLTVTPTRDLEYLRRWMLRPAFVRKLGVELDAATLDAGFRLALASDAVFFDVRLDGEEKGCIIFSKKPGGWEIHTCLATWLRDTRTAIREAIRCVLGPDERVTATYPAARRSINRLLDELGFSTGAFASGWRTREFIP
jgi:hypothetical protein